MNRDYITAKAFLPVVIILLLLSFSTNAQKKSLTDSLNIKDSIAIHISIERQDLVLLKEKDTLAHYPVSTSEYGVGSEAGSNKTPTGKHYVIKKFGEGAPVGTIFESRRNTGKVATIYKSDTNVEEDHVTTRILRLAGLEPGKNRGDGIDSFSRYIYIHGTPEEGLIGQPASHGCIRMNNQDVIELFNMVPEKTLVMIKK